MIVLQVNIHVKEEYLEAFKQATIENARNSLQEPGIAQFGFVQQEDDPTRFMLIEAYRNPEAMVAHKETAHYDTWQSTVADMLVEPRSRMRYINVYPGDEDWA